MNINYSKTSLILLIGFLFLELCGISALGQATPTPSKFRLGGETRRNEYDRAGRTEPAGADANKKEAPGAPPKTQDSTRVNSPRPVDKLADPDAKEASAKKKATSAGEQASPRVPPTIASPMPRAEDRSKSSPTAEKKESPNPSRTPEPSK